LIGSVLNIFDGSVQDSSSVQIELLYFPIHIVVSQ
jgi:hypothetical protein